LVGEVTGGKPAIDVMLTALEFLFTILGLKNDVLVLNPLSWVCVGVGVWVRDKFARSLSDTP